MALKVAASYKPSTDGLGYLTRPMRPYLGLAPPLEPPIEVFIGKNATSVGRRPVRSSDEEDDRECEITGWSDFEDNNGDEIVE